MGVKKSQTLKKNWFWIQFLGSFLNCFISKGKHPRLPKNKQQPVSRSLFFSTPHCKSVSVMTFCFSEIVISNPKHKIVKLFIPLSTFQGSPLNTYISEFFLSLSLDLD